MTKSDRRRVARRSPKATNVRRSRRSRSPTRFRGLRGTQLIDGEIDEEEPRFNIIEDELKGLTVEDFDALQRIVFKLLQSRKGELMDGILTITHQKLIQLERELIRKEIETINNKGGEQKEAIEKLSERDAVLKTYEKPPGDVIWKLRCGALERGDN